LVHTAWGGVKGSLPHFPIGHLLIANLVFTGIKHLHFLQKLPVKNSHFLHKSNLFFLEVSLAKM